MGMYGYAKVDKWKVKKWKIRKVENWKSGKLENCKSGIVEKGISEQLIFFLRKSGKLEK